MLKLRALVRLLKPWSLRRGSGLTTIAVLWLGSRKGLHYGPKRPRAIPRRPRHCCDLRHSLSWATISANADPSMTIARPLLTPHLPLKTVASPLAPDAETMGRFLDHCHRRKHASRTDVFRPGDAASSLYYVISGSLSVVSEESDGRELVLGYVNAGEFIGEMGLF